MYICYIKAAKTTENPKNRLKRDEYDENTWIFSDVSILEVTDMLSKSQMIHEISIIRAKVRIYYRATAIYLRFLWDKCLYVCRMREDLVILAGMVAALFVFGAFLLPVHDERIAENTVYQFFEAVATENYDEITQIYQEYDGQNLQQLNETFSNLSNSDIYGEDFCSKLEKFRQYMFQNLYAQISVKDISYSKGEYRITVTGKSKTDFIYDSSYLRALVDEYQTVNQENLLTIYKTEGYLGMIKKIYGDLADDIIKNMKEQLYAWEAKEFTSVFTVQNTNNDFYITSIEGN